MKDNYSSPLKSLNYKVFMLITLLFPNQANALWRANINQTSKPETRSLIGETTSNAYNLLSMTNLSSSKMMVLLPEVNSLAQDTDTTDFKVPEGFSPNGDGINDILNIDWIKEYDRVRIVIFNRWGNIVFKTDNFSGQWDGLSNTGTTIGKKLPAATYYYVITIEDIYKKINGYIYLAW